MHDASNATEFPATTRLVQYKGMPILPRVAPASFSRLFSGDKAHEKYCYVCVLFVFRGSDSVWCALLCHLWTGFRTGEHGI